MDALWFWPPHSCILIVYGSTLFDQGHGYRFFHCCAGGTDRVAVYPSQFKSRHLIRIADRIGSGHRRCLLRLYCRFRSNLYIKFNNKSKSLAAAHRRTLFMLFRAGKFHKTPFGSTALQQRAGTCDGVCFRPFSNTHQSDDDTLICSDICRSRHCNSCKWLCVLHHFGNGCLYGINPVVGVVDRNCRSFKKKT